MLLPNHWEQVISLPYGQASEQEVKDEGGAPAAAEKQTEKEQLEIREKIEIVNQIPLH